VSIEQRFNDLLEDSISFIKSGFHRSGAESADGREQSPPSRDGKLPAPARDSSAHDTSIESNEPVESIDTIVSIEKEIRRCTKCRLHERRRNAVPGSGNRSADILFIGEGPGEQEDMQGLPFVGKAGQLLTKMLAAIDLKREEVFITNIVKCRPPGNRNPQPEEVDACFPYLERQISGIAPLVIVCLGGPAAKAVLKSPLSITRLRGRFHRYGEVPVLATYHPAAVLRFPEKYKRDVWNDLKLLRDFYRDVRP
jgi:DNA polymerase